MAVAALLPAWTERGESSRIGWWGKLGPKDLSTAMDADADAAQ